MAKIPTRLKWTTSTRKDGTKRFQWTKIYKGKRKTWSLKAGESKADGAKRIKAECQKWMAEIDAIENGLLASVAEKKKQVEELEKQRDEVEEQDAKTHYLEVRQRLESAGISGEEAARQAIDAVMLRYLVGDSPDDMSFAGEPYWLKGLGFDASKHPETWEDARSELFPDEKPQGHTIASTVKAFMDRQRGLETAGQKSKSRIDLIRVCKEKFVKWYQSEKGSLNQSVDRINAGILTEYHTHLMMMVSNEQISPEYAKNQMQVLIQLTKWAYENEYLDRLPRNLGTANLTIRQPSKKINLMDITDFQDIFKIANDRTKLFMLLQVNCGFTSKDISDLKKEEIDLKIGTITRKRSKTANQANAPTITYFLWQETINLLKQELNKKGDSALVGTNGEPINSTKIRDDGKLQRNDIVKSCYFRAIKKLNNWRGGKTTKTDVVASIEALGLSDRIEPATMHQKLLRATSGTMLDEHDIYGRYAPYFLGHSPKSVSSKHYVKPSNQQFQKACEYLRKAWGFPIQ